LITVAEAIKTALQKTGDQISKKLVKALSTGKRTGRVYMRRGRKHRSSAAGEIPAKDTGRLAKSVKYNVGNKFVRIGETAPYAKHLEYGTSRMAARPHLAVTVEANRKILEEQLNEQIKKAFKI
jgi:HK97 gp10 family phage protein